MTSYDHHSLTDISQDCSVARSTACVISHSLAAWLTFQLFLFFFRPGEHNLYKNENFFFPFLFHIMLFFLEVELFFLSPLTTASHTLTAIPGLSASPQNFRAKHFSRPISPGISCWKVMKAVRAAPLHTKCHLSDSRVTRKVIPQCPHVKVCPLICFPLVQFSACWSEGSYV